MQNREERVNYWRGWIAFISALATSIYLLADALSFIPSFLDKWLAWALFSLRLLALAKPSKSARMRLLDSMKPSGKHRD